MFRLRLLQGRTVAVQAACVSAGAVAQRISLWGIVVLLNRHGSAEVVGSFALAMAAVLPLSRFAALQLPQIILAKKPSGSDFAEFNMAHLISVSLVLVATVVSCALLPIETMFFNLVLSLAIARAFEGVSELAYAFLQREGRFGVVSSLQFGRSLLTIGAAVVVYLATNSVVGLAIALAVVWGGCALLLDLPVAYWLATSRSKNTLTCSWLQVVGLLKSSLILGVCSLMIIGFGSLPRYALHIQDGVASVGVFESIAALTLLVDLLSQSVSRVMAPRFSRALEAGDPRQLFSLYRRAAGMYVALGAAGVVGGVALGKSVLAWVYSPEYAGYSGLLIVLLVARAVSAASSYDSLLVSLEKRALLVAVWVASLLALCVTLACPVGSDALVSVGLAVLAASSVRCVATHGALYWCFRERHLRPGEMAIAIREIPLTSKPVT